MNNKISTFVSFPAITLFSLFLLFLAIKGFKSFVLRIQARNYFYDLLHLHAVSHLTVHYEQLRDFFCINAVSLMAIIAIFTDPCKTISSLIPESAKPLLFRELLTILQFSAI